MARQQQGKAVDAQVGHCPVCGARSAVTDSRTPLTDNRWIKRRRKCTQCPEHWTTLEISEVEYDRIERIAKMFKDLDEVRRELGDTNA